MTRSVLIAVGISLLWYGEAAACAGDCNRDEEVTVDELVVGVRMALDLTTERECAAINADGDAEVRLDEVTGAVNAALTGCPVPRLLAIARDGHMASLDVAAPWTVRAS